MKTDGHGGETSAAAPKSRVGYAVRVIAFTVLVVAVVIVVAGRLRKVPEPVNGGRPISAWLEQMVSSVDSAERNAAGAAVIALGTNAVPWLISELTGRVPRWKYQVHLWLHKQPFTAFRFDVYAPYRKKNRALDGFRALGADAKVAIPELVEMNRKAPDDYYPLAALAYCGDTAIPILWKNLTNYHSRIGPGQAALAIRAAVSSGSIPLGKAASFVPTLNELLKSSNAYITNKAYLTLKLIQERAKENSPRDSTGVVP